MSTILHIGARMASGPCSPLTCAFALASAILAWHPIAWLARTWLEPAYGSLGWVYALAVFALAMASVASGPARGGTALYGVLRWLLLAAALRLAGQVLAINILSAMALTVDVFALLSLLRIDRRPLALSPFWLAVLFLFALPFEPILQRILGFPLQLIGAAGACQILGFAFADLACTGTRIAVAGKDVAVDLPCSGSMGLMVMAAITVTINALLRPRFVIACAALLATAILAIGGNSLRIAALAAGIALEDTTGVNVMAEPWHSLIGLVTTAMALLPLVLGYRPQSVPAKRLPWPVWRLPRPLQVAAAILAVPAALAITHATARPLDVSSTPQGPALPAQIMGALKAPEALTPMEETYFQRFGGRALKASYGPLGLNLVSTTSPLRHLHSPEACLRGLGFKVEFLGSRFDGDLSSAVYLAKAPGGAVYEVAVSYVSDDGRQAGSVAQAIWLWLKSPGSSWTAVQRLLPLNLPARERALLDLAALAALDISTRKPSTATTFAQSKSSGEL